MPKRKGYCISCGSNTIQISVILAEVFLGIASPINTDTQTPVGTSTTASHSAVACWLLFSTCAFTYSYMERTDDTTACIAERNPFATLSKAPVCL